MSLKHLEQIAGSAGIDQAFDERQALAQQACSQGAVLLGLAEAQGYADRQLVMQGCHLMMDAIQYSRSFIDPYLHLVHVYLVFSDDLRALKYLKAAQEIDPTHPDIAIYLDYLQQTDKATQEAPEPHTQALPASASHDPQDVEGWIFAQVKQWMSSEWVRAGNGLSLSQLEQVCQQIGETLTIIGQHLRALEHEIETGPLELKIRPLELLLGRYRLKLKTAQEREALDLRLQELTHQARQLYRQNRPVTEAQDPALEALIDACDLAADQLDALEAQKADVSELLTNYQVLLRLIQGLMDPDYEPQQ